MARTLTAVSESAPPAPIAFSAQLAVSVRERGMPPEVHALRAATQAELIEELFVAVASRASIPLLALREILENLVHARFRGVVLTILDNGRLVRCSDSGPGIDDPDRAFQEGYTSATDAERELIRGVGSGLTIATRSMEEVGGALTLDENLGGGTVIALHAPSAAAQPPADGTSDSAQATLALLLEMGSAGAGELAEELGCELGRCGRDLVVLEHRGLVAREPNGNRRLTESGAAMVAALF